MDTSDLMDSTDVMSSVEEESRPTKSRKKKRMWREIETFKEKYRLRKELEELDMFNEYDLSGVDI